MSRARAEALAPVCALLVSAVGATLVVVLPSLVVTGPDAAGSAMLAVLVLTFAVLVRSGTRSVVCFWPVTAAPSTRGAPAPVLPGRVTDRVHHPLRPRAPGLT